MSCNCNPSELRKKYAGMFFSGVSSSKPEKAAEKELKKKTKKKDEKTEIL